MIRYPNTFRFRLLSLFVVSVIMLSAILMAALPLYFTNTMHKENTILVNSTLTAIEHNFDNYFDELERLTIMPYYNQEFMDSLMMINSSQYEELTEYEKFIIRQDIDYTLSYYLQNTREDITNALFISNSLMTFITTKKYGSVPLQSGYDVEYAKWYQEALLSNENFIFVSAHSQDYIGQDEKVFSVARQIKDPISQKKLGVLMADMDSAILEKLLKNLDFGVSSVIVVLDGQGEKIYTTSYVSQDIIVALDAVNEGSIELPDGSYQVITRSFEELPWEIHVLLSESEQAQKISGIYIVGGGIILIGVLVVGFIYMIVSKRLTKPLTEMLAIIQQIESGELSLRFDEAGTDEFAYLRHSLNGMLNQINRLIEREYQVTIEKQAAEFQALQSQIQPHFLYNTLAGFIGLNRLGEKAKLETSILNLTKQMRYILEQDDVTTIDDEISLLESYCGLQQLRFGDRLHFEFDVESGLESFEIPKLLLQPTVENAIIHGLEKRDKEGHLKVVVSRKESQYGQAVVIEISDDGVGFDTTKLDQNYSVGITNTINRLKLLDNNATYVVDSTIGEGTTVCITIPITGGSKDENSYS